MTRRGYTLLEVLVSLTIFLMSLTAIAHLISVGAARAVDVQMESRGSQLAQSKLAEVVTGAQAMDGSEGNFPQDPDWSWSIQSSQGDLTGLWNVTVTVRKERANSTPIEVSLNQMVLDPSYRGSSFDTPPAAATDTSSTGSSSSPTGSGASSASAPGASSGTATKPTTGGGATKPTTTGGSTTRPTTGSGSTPSTGGTTTPRSGSGTGTGTTPSSGGSTTPRSGSGAGTGTTPSSGGTPTPRTGSGTRGG